MRRAWYIVSAEGEILMKTLFSEIGVRELFIGTYVSPAGTEQQLLFLKLGDRAGSQSYTKAREGRDASLGLLPGNVLHFFEPGSEVQRLGMVVE